MTATIDRLADFVVGAEVPPAARAVAATAWFDTIGVMLAGAVEPAALAVQEAARSEGDAGPCRIAGTRNTANASWAALANGTAAHALDYDDMCFVSLAHPSAPLVAASLAAGELSLASGRALLDAWVVGFEVEAVLGRAMNPRHYTQGWHCTSTIGTVGAAAAVARLMGLDRGATTHCLAIAASEASGLKENFGTMTKPLHAGLAARNGVVAALLARSGITASAEAIDGPQGLLAAMGSERPDLGDTLDTLGSRWEALETGVTVKLYPSCAGTHPALDAVLDLRREHGFTAADVASIDIGVDAVTPTILIHDRPATGLEGKFSMPFCVAAAVVNGSVGLDTFEPALVNDARIRDFMPRVTMTVDASLKTNAPALTQARVTVRLRDGRTLSAYADGARGYPARPATAEQLEAKFRSCAGRVLDAKGIDTAIRMLRSMDQLTEARKLVECLSPALDLRYIEALAGEYELVTEQPTSARGGPPLRTRLRLRWEPRDATLAGEEEYEGVQPGSLIRQPVTLSDATLLIGNPAAEGGPSRYEILSSTPDGFRGTWRTHQPRSLRESQGTTEEWAMGNFRAIRYGSHAPVSRAGIP